MGLLSETQIKAAKPGSKEYLLNDGDNLFLRVRDTGKAWVYRYMKDGKPIKLGMGPYPAVTLAQARAKAYEANSQRASGQDPKEIRERQEEQARIAQLNTFELLARAWHASAKKDREWSEDYAGKVIRHLEIHVFPWVGRKPIETILPTEIVGCLHRPKDRGNLETAQRVREPAHCQLQEADGLAWTSRLAIQGPGHPARCTQIRCLLEMGRAAYGAPCRADSDIRAAVHEIERLVSNGENISTESGVYAKAMGRVTTLARFHPGEAAPLRQRLLRAKQTLQPLLSSTPSAP